MERRRDAWRWAYLLSETCDRAGTVRTSTTTLTGSALRQSNSSSGRRGLERSVTCQVKPGGEECDSANKVAPRRRKRPGFSLPPLPSSHSPSRRRRLSERHSAHATLRRRHVATQGEERGRLLKRVFKNGNGRMKKICCAPCISMSTFLSAGMDSEGPSVRPDRLLSVHRCDVNFLKLDC